MNAVTAQRCTRWDQYLKNAEKNQMILTDVMRTDTMSISQHLEEIEKQADEIEMKAQKSDNGAMINLAQAFRKLVYSARFSLDAIDKGDDC